MSCSLNWFTYRGIRNCLLNQNSKKYVGQQNKSKDTKGYPKDACTVLSYPVSLKPNFEQL